MPPLATTMLSPLSTARCEPGGALIRAGQCARLASTGQMASVSNPNVQATRRCTVTMVAWPKRPSTSEIDATATRATTSRVADAGTPNVRSVKAARASAATMAVTVSQPTRLTQLTRAGPMLPGASERKAGEHKHGQAGLFPSHPEDPDEQERKRRSGHGHRRPLPYIEAERGDYGPVDDPDNPEVGRQPDPEQLGRPAMTVPVRHGSEPAGLDRPGTVHG